MNYIRNTECKASAHFALSSRLADVFIRLLLALFLAFAAANSSHAEPVTTGPYVGSITPAAATGVGTTQIIFDVVFTESVTGVSNDDFELRTTGTLSGTIGNITSSGNTYSVTIGNLSGDGSLYLDLRAGTDISTAGGNKVAGFSGGTSYERSRATPAMTVDMSPTNPAYGDDITFTASFANGVSPSGTVYFSNMTTQNVSIANGVAVATYSDLDPAVYTFIVQYGGDGNNLDTYASKAFTVTKRSPTITLATPSGLTTLGTAVTFTATIGNGHSPTGTITFKNESGTLRTVSVVNGSASFTTSAFPAGSTNVTAQYSGDDGHNAAASPPLTINVVQPPAAVTLTASPSSIEEGDNVTLTATVTSNQSPTGNVVFRVDGAAVGTVALLNGVATLTYTPSQPGSYEFTAEYVGDANNGAATSSAVAVTVNGNWASLTLSISPTPIRFGETVTFTATVTGRPIPSGTVSFANGATSIGYVTIYNGAATLSTSTLPLGVNTIHARYENGSINSNASVAVAVISALTISPTSGSLPNATAGANYAQTITATGGVGASSYSLTTGSLPTGLSLSATTGEISGTVDAASAGNSYQFTVQITDSTGSSVSASYTLVVDNATLTAPSHSRPAIVGSPTNVDLTLGATGGPFTGANVVSVTPSHAGTASIVRGEYAQASGSTTLGWYLKFVPRAGYSGSVSVGYTLSNASGTSGVGTVTYAMLGYDPAEEAAKINDLVSSFVETRQSLLSSSITLPGLLERRQAFTASEAVSSTFTPSEAGMSASFSTSIAQIEAARDRADGIDGSNSSPFNIWINGSFQLHNRDENGDEWGSFGLISLGADYLLSDRALIGFSAHYDRMSDPTKDDAQLTGSGWLAGPYASFELGNGVFWDSTLLYGGSFNDLESDVWNGDFSSSRWIMDTSIKGQWLIDDVTVLTPKLRALYFHERVDDYTIGNELGDELTVDGFDKEQFRVSLGAELARTFTLETGSRLTPKLGLTGGVSGIDGSGAFGSLSAGVALETDDFWMLDAALLYSIEGDGQQSVGARFKAGRKF